MRSVYFKQTLKSIVFSTFLSFLCCQSMAAVHLKQQEANPIITELYHSLEHVSNPDMANRLDVISAQFLGKPYILGALGEGTKAHFDQEPRYRIDGFDCDTYVTTVLALALANDQQGFKQCMMKVRYKDGKVSFITRNHFTSLDWNPNNQQQGFIKDITETFRDKDNKSVAEIATALIDKPSWYQHFTDKNIHLNPSDDNERSKRLAELKERGSKLPKQLAQVPYLPFTALFDAQGNPNQFLFAQIPNASIIEIVRPNWDLREQIGTNLNVSHLGFAFWKGGVLYFRQASSKFGHVVEVPLIDYLHEALSSPTIKGINVEVIVPQSPLSDNCTANPAVF
ncbi:MULTISPECIES: N-acetylmuramoyl-L-alanine amidase-like domain-containing protein [Legionella]|uniref:DUF1460 domain-containing protein n=1 Tax=Legionella maceachernii TaxID=466 RepID=A0A0W0W6H9_9GAMM|nr:N-acetylmuramoyl-L-alanine amidase-like domain-containing protein [Legionella maceachernii]KTD27930.1 hypothetical protein Lmac_0989 [Legionella maceachernii]SKA25715.1 Protein of unknown function [Legionella maceachernii]SUP00038.1 Protein of uncharacterised function (DUF1460) [Legionella maceachernii]